MASDPDNNVEGRRSGDGRRIGIVGLGQAGGYVIEALAILGRTVVVAIDPRGEQARAARFVRGAPIETNLSCLGDYSLDTLIVCTPSPSHTEVLRAVVASKPRGLRHVWCEKPLTRTRAEAEDTWALFAKTDVAVKTLFHAAFRPEVLWAANRADELRREHGLIEHLVATYEDPYARHIASRAESLTGSWIDSGVNALSVVARFLSDLKVQRVSGESPRWATAHLAAGLNGATAVIHTSWEATKAQKTTRMQFSTGADVVLDHVAGRADIRLRGSTIGGVSFDTMTFAERYAEMLRAYFGETSALLSRRQECEIYSCLGDVADRIPEPPLAR